MKIEISEDNVADIEGALRWRTDNPGPKRISTYLEVAAFRDAVIRRLGQAQLNVDEVHGIKASYTPSGPGRYGGFIVQTDIQERPIDTTTLFIECDGSTWFLTNIKECVKFPFDDETFLIMLTPEQNQLVIDRSTSQFAVIGDAWPEPVEKPNDES